MCAPAQYQIFIFHLKSSFIPKDSHKSFISCWGGFIISPGASALISSRIGFSLTPGCPFMVVTAHESVFWLDRNWHCSLVFSDIQLCISPLRLQELGLVLMFFLCLFPQLLISRYLQNRFTHAGFKLPFSMVWNPSCGPFFMDFLCFPHACMALLLFLEDNHSRHALSELSSMPDGH